MEHDRPTEERGAQDSGTIKHTACPVFPKVRWVFNNRCSLLLWVTGGQHDNVGVISESAPSFVWKTC